MRGSKIHRKRQKAILIRAAKESDFEVLCSFDQVAKKEEKRRASIQRAIARGSCFIAVMGQEVIGYGALNHTFYDHGFISLLYVAAERRRQGVGATLRHNKVRRERNQRACHPQDSNAYVVDRRRVNSDVGRHLS